MPSVITFTDGNTITYGYDASGQKLSVTHLTATAGIVIPMTNIMTPLAPANIAITTKTDYCGNVIYENGALSKILTEEGYITFSGTTPVYHYYLKDHQGNNRVVINQSGAVQQANHYYAFGGLFGEGIQTSNQPYKYNGKELDRFQGVDMYDYGARHYDAALGRWGTVDPLAEKYYSISSYVYVANNPVRFIDPNGMNLDEYGLDKKTGQLSLIKEKPEDIDDYIKVGIFNEDGSFTDDKTIEAFELPTGILRGDAFEDLSESGIIARDIELGVDLMEFISFNTYKEVHGIGFELSHNSKKMSEGLSISPWVSNTYNESKIFDLQNYMGTPLFYIHTHPGKEGSNGFGYSEPSRDDRVSFRRGYDHYILSRYHGLTIYYPTGIFHMPVVKTTHPGLRNKIKHTL